MSFKKIVGIFVAAGIILALGIEFWTFGEMIWLGFTNGKHSAEKISGKHDSKVDDQFEIKQISGRFKKLLLTPNGSTWYFSCVVVLTNTETNRKSISFSKVQLRNGDIKPINKMIKLHPKKSRTLQFRRKIPPGSSPLKLKIKVKTGSETIDRWVRLPKVPVRAS